MPLTSSFDTRGRVVRGLFLALIGGVGGLLVTLVIVTSQQIADRGDLFIDYVFYRDLGARFLNDGSYYLPHQLAGPHEVRLMVDVIYPPSALLLFVPASLVPALLWWAVPVGTVAYALYRWRPARWAVVVILALLCWPRAHAAFLFGNTDMWAMAGIAAGLLWGWPATLLTLKPIFAPFALVGICHWSWWAAALGMIAFGLATLPMWLQYITVVTNVRAGADYSLGSLPLLAVPVVAWLGRHEEPR